MSFFQTITVIYSFSHSFALSLPEDDFVFLPFCFTHIVLIEFPLGVAVVPPQRLTVSAVTVAIEATAVTAVTAAAAQLALTAPLSIITPPRLVTAETKTRLRRRIPAGAQASLHREAAAADVVVVEAAPAMPRRPLPTLPWRKWRPWPQRQRRRVCRFLSHPQPRRVQCLRLRWPRSWRLSTLRRRRAHHPLAGKEAPAADPRHFHHRTVAPPHWPRLCPL